MEKRIKHQPEPTIYADVTPADLGDMWVLRALLERAWCNVEPSHGGPFSTIEGTNA